MVYKQVVCHYPSWDSDSRKGNRHKRSRGQGKWWQVTGSTTEEKEKGRARGGPTGEGGLHLREEMHSWSPGARELPRKGRKSSPEKETGIDWNMQRTGEGEGVLAVKGEQRAVSSGEKWGALGKEPGGLVGSWPPSLCRPVLTVETGTED